METAVKMIVSIIGATASYMYGSWSPLLGILVTVVVLDYMTGLISAWINGELNSDYGLKGIAKKVFIFALVSVGHITDVLLGHNPLIREAVIMFYIINELISITENAGKAGVPLPYKLSKAIHVLKQKDRRLK